MQAATTMTPEAAPVPDEPGRVNCELKMPNMAQFYDYIEANARYATQMVKHNSHKGKRVIICGAGPSLAAYAPALPWAHQVWACNSALPYLMGLGAPVTHGFAIDQGESMLRAAEWGTTFDVTYLLASSVNPRLVAHLAKAGRRFRFFHNYLGPPNPEGWVPPTPGLSYEMWLYQTKYATSCQVGYGLNSVPRAICLALIMGFKEIEVYGADCACAPDQAPMPPLRTTEYDDWIEHLVIYADGRTVSTNFGIGTPMTEGWVDGHRWTTRPDMVISAMHLLDLQRGYPGRIRLIGDTLPNALAKQPPEFFENMPRLTNAGVVRGFGDAGTLHPTEVAA